MDRLIGYGPPLTYLPKVVDILKRKNTIDSKKLELTKNPGRHDLLYDLGKKYLDRGEYEISDNYFNEFLKNVSFEMREKIVSAKFYLAKSAWENADISALIKFVEDYPSDIHSLSAYQMISKYYITINDTIKEIETLWEMTEKFPKNTMALNSYAWRMTELNRNLEDALIKAKKGVELATPDSKAMILDTQAEIEWMLGDTKSAIGTIKAAIELNPDDEYFKFQLKKFKTVN
ncbi:MAG: hypothetical protein VX770_08085 [Candidatus Neomarinimicrobiota bacterium]|nr:hypothetical protein [Candidatus Neomarinimicrobiota bacterium]